MSNLPPVNSAISREAQSLDILQWAIAHYPQLAMTSAFNLNGVVLIDMAVKAGYKGEVLFVDTNYHFPETLETRDHLSARYPELNFVTLSANLADDKLYRQDTERCCFLRKVKPLQDHIAAKAYNAILNARSRDQAHTRASLDIVEPFGSCHKIHPLVFWQQADLEAYALREDLPLNPLYWQGYLSIGCAPCTRPVRQGEALRDGRWTGQEKTECGLWWGKQAL
ncbi:MAG: phosphoadenylyl-sulfate reductase [Deinococcales bacterium]